MVHRNLPYRFLRGQPLKLEDSACSTSRNTGKPEHPGTPQKPGTPPKTRNTREKNRNTPQKTRNTPRKPVALPKKPGTPPQNTKKSAKSKKLNK